MKIVETFGLYHYEVTGNREAEAAAELDEAYDFLSRSHLSGQAYEIELADARERIERDYGVEIVARI